MSEHAVGFVGTGIIGTPMAQRVLDAGHDLVVHDARRDATAGLTAAGADWAATPAAVAEACPLVLLSLPGPAEVEQVVTGPEGVLAGARPGTVIVDLSTNSVATVRAMHRRCGDVGVHYVDAPVSGGAHGAANGTLTVMASGARAAVARAEPVLAAFGRTITYVGDSGSGTIVKLVNNQIFLCAALVVQEAAVMADKAGLDVDELVEVLGTGSAAPYLGYASFVLGRRFDSGIFALSLAEKDVALALESARSLGVPMPVTAAAHQVYLHARAVGLGHEDFVATLKTIEAAAGIDSDRGSGRDSDSGADGSATST